jgi:uncharacterized protein YjbJ (UPF0337 family)
MNWDMISGSWKQLHGKAREEWGKLTDDDLEYIGGRKDQLVGKLQERYGYAKEEAERRVNAWADRYHDAGNKIPGIQTGGQAVDGTPDTRGITEKIADALTGDRIDDKTGKVVR